MASIGQAELSEAQQGLLVGDVVGPEAGGHPEGQDPGGRRVADQLVQVGGHRLDIILADEAGT